MNHRTFLVTGLTLVMFGLGGNSWVSAQQSGLPRSEKAPLSIKESLRVLGSRHIDSSERYPVLMKLVAREKAFHDVKPVIVSSLEDKNADIRSAAVAALPAFTPNDKSLLPMVERLIADKDSGVRLDASYTAWIMGRSKKAVHEATALLDNPDKTIRAYAALLIEDMGESAVSAAPKLADRLSEPDEMVVLCVGKALDKMGCAALEPLLEKTHSPSARVRSLAIACVGDMKSADPRITKAILHAMNDTDWDVRDSAVEAVGKSQILEPLVTEKLIILLNDPEDMVCEATAKALAEFGVNKAIPALEEAMTDRRVLSDREAIAYSLGELRAVEAIPTLDKVMQEERTMQEQDSARGPSVREAIVSALGHMGPAAIPALERAKNDPEKSVREVAAESLQRIVSEIKESNSTPSPSTRGCERHRLRGCRSCCIQCAG